MIHAQRLKLHLPRWFKKLKELLSLIFLKLITSIIRLATAVVKGIYDGYMAFRRFATGKYHGIWIVFLLLIIIGTLSVIFVRQKHVSALESEKQQIELQKKELEETRVKDQEKIQKLEEDIKKKDEEIKKLSYKPKVVKTTYAAAAPKTSYNGTLAGKVSHYSRSGCLGCSPNLTMANGQPLDDNALTIAVPPGTIPMNTPVKVINETNGKEVIATVTDTGGFSKYNRVADLTPAVANALGTQTDISNVRIEPIN